MDQNPDPPLSPIAQEQQQDQLQLLQDQRTQGPPTDDCCPICFGDFTVPCRSDCDHWFCAGCILEFWQYGVALQPCKCPMCSREIKKLTPETSLLHRDETQVVKVLEKVHRYNSLYVGGARGLVVRIKESPLFFKRIIWDMMDPDKTLDGWHLFGARLFAMILVSFVILGVGPFQFIPTGGLSSTTLVDLADYSVIIVVYGLQLIGHLRRQWLLHRAREPVTSDQ